MTILRSREVKSVGEPLPENNSPNSNNTKQPRVSSIEPKTQSPPASNTSTPMTDKSSTSGSVRRSARLAAKACDRDVEKSQLVSSSSSRKRKSVASVIDEGEVKSCGGGSDKNEGGVELGNDVVEDSMSKKGECEGGLRFEVESGIDRGMDEVLKKGNRDGKGKRKVGLEFEGEGDGGCVRLRSGKKLVLGGGVRGTGRGDDDDDEEKGGGDCGGEGNGARGDFKSGVDDRMEGGSGKVETLVDGGEGVNDSGEGRSSRKDKGKGKLIDMVVEPEAPEIVVESEEAPRVAFSDSGNVAMQDGMPEDPRAEMADGDAVPVQDGAQVQVNDVEEHYATRTRDRFRAQARRSASRFAFFSTVEGEQSHAAGEAGTETAAREINTEMEDWPGPFSTAMKIIRERGTNVKLQKEKGKEASQVMWVPKQEKDRKRSNMSVPLLQELCMRTLTKNADAITSLDYVPDVLRHKLSHMLCNMRSMNSHFLELLVRGSPTEIRVRDCSWLSEEDFTKIFAGADINNLAVLQLDQCGRCMPDYILHSTLGRAPNCMPLLSTLSLKGACRLSDTGLRTLISSAPSLRSINLSECSLLTSGGMDSLADSLGPVLRELYLDVCESIDPILMLPALSKLEHLEVLSLAGLHTVSDDFICQLIALRGEKLKELVLANCVNLTDISLKVISSSCTGICALDLTNLRKLTDSAIGYLANGCQRIRSLRLGRNIFSDEAVAAYLETSGAALEELSLNNVSKVAYNTAISLSKCSKNLQHLDISFSRNLSEEAVGLIADSCLSLKTLKLFGCTQITDVFLDGHSNEQVQVIGLPMTPILEHIKVPELVGPLRYSSVSSQ